MAPVLQILNSGGKDIVPKLDGWWLSCSVTEHEDGKSDSASIECVGPPAVFGLPAEGDEFTILMGWEEDGGPVEQGRFSMQKPRMYGSPGNGHRIALQFRAADYKDKHKHQINKHYDEGKTLGEIVRDQAKAMGLDGVVDPELDKIKLPYQLIWQQSRIDYLGELVERYGGSMKPMQGKLLVQKRGAGKSASGLDLAPIEIPRHICSDYDFEIDPRSQARKIAAQWLDPKSGKRKFETQDTDRDGGVFVLPHPYRSQDEAQQAAKSEATERDNRSGTGRCTHPGMPKARAGAPVMISEFGWPVDGKWKATTLTKRMDASGGFIQTTEVKAGADNKTKKTGGGTSSGGSSSGGTQEAGAIPPQAVA
ncbi:MAG: hypothetical protein QM651_08340 [Rhodoblastus sp.]